MRIERDQRHGSTAVFEHAPPLSATVQLSEQSASLCAKTYNFSPPSGHRELFVCCFLQDPFRSVKPFLLLSVLPKMAPVPSIILPTTLPAQSTQATQHRFQTILSLDFKYCFSEWKCPQQKNKPHLQL